MNISPSNDGLRPQPVAMARVAAAVLILAWSQCAHAGTSVVDFDNVAEGAIATNALSGAVITGASVLTEASELNIQYPPHSGHNVVYDYLDGTVAIAFSGPESSVGAYITTERQLTLTLFNGATTVGTLVTPFSTNYTGSNPSYGPNFFFSLSAPAITSATFSNTAGISDTFTIDDLTVVGNTVVTVSTVPEPGTFALLCGGLVALTFVRRSRRQERGRQ